MRPQIKKTSILLLLIISIITVPAIAGGIDGYKNFTWDMSSKELLKQIKNDRFCKPQDRGTDAMGIRTIVCYDFPFADEKRYGYFLLVSDRLLRIVISIEKNEVAILGEIFNKDYGRPSSGSAPLRGVLTKGSVGWAGDTILIKRIEVSENTKQSKGETTEYYVLMYSSFKYNELLQKEQEKKYRSFTK